MQVVSIALASVQECPEFKEFELVASQLRGAERPTATELEAAAMKIPRCGGFLRPGQDRG